MCEITSDNFAEYFFDVRTHRPKPGQILAKFTAVADFVGGQYKKDIINLLKIDKAASAAQVMRKIHCVKEPDCYRVLREIAQDLLVLSEKEVEEKEYEMVVELFFYTQREHVPASPNWETIILVEFPEVTA